jgi:NitT/TauT family transport system substrate-binding protein
VISRKALSLKQRFGGRRLPFLIAVCAALAAATVLPRSLSADDLVTVNIGVLNTITDIPLILADRKGFFTAEGIAPKFTAFASSSVMVVPLATGQLDVGGGGAGVGLYNAVARKLDIKIVADKASDPKGYGFESLLVRSDLIKSGRFRTPKDLKGMTMSANQPGGVSYIMLVELLRKYGLTVADVKLENLDFPNHVLALANGELDATVTEEPYVTLATTGGQATQVLSSDSWYPSQEISVLIYGRDFLSKRDLAVRFMRAYLRGVRYYDAALKGGHINGTNADEICTIINQTTEVKTLKLCHEMTAMAIDPNGRLNVAGMQSDLATFRDLSLTQGDVSVTDVVDDSFLNAALRQIGTVRQLR